jgi:NAD(P)-dependent dehydrogenase (short-subunit alcohol dehydrogenase family)
LATANPKLIILAGRSKERASTTIDAIKLNHPSVGVSFVTLDTASIKSVRNAAAEIKTLTDKIDVLINNAGVMAVPYSKTEDGLEQQFATNHVGHFLLTNLIIDQIIAAGPGSRIVNLSSFGHRRSPVRFDDYGFQNGETYDPWLAYGQSKTANILFSLSLAEKLKSKGVRSYSVHPGGIWTGLGLHLSAEVVEALKAGVGAGSKLKQKTSYGRSMIKT